MAAARYPSSSGPQLKARMDQCNSDTGDIDSQVRRVKYEGYSTRCFSIGDQIARCTSETYLGSHLTQRRIADDIFRSTVHRATNRTDVHRYSIPLFFGTDYHVSIEVCWCAFSLNSAQLPYTPPSLCQAVSAC